MTFVLLTLVLASLTVAFLVASVIASRRRRYSGSRWLLLLGIGSLVAAIAAVDVVWLDLVHTFLNALAAGDRAIVQK